MEPEPEIIMSRLFLNHSRTWGEIVTAERCKWGLTVMSCCCRASMSGCLQEEGTSEWSGIPPSSATMETRLGDISVSFRRSWTSFVNASVCTDLRCRQITFVVKNWLTTWRVMWDFIDWRQSLGFSFYLALRCFFSLDIFFHQRTNKGIHKKGIATKSNPVLLMTAHKALCAL